MGQVEMGRWYTCGTCRFCVTRKHLLNTCRDGPLHEVPISSCTLDHEDAAGPEGGCPSWLPPRDAWKSERCGTCDYRGEILGCQRGPPTTLPWKGDDTIHEAPKVGEPRSACAEWMPRPETG